LSRPHADGYRYCNEKDASSLQPGDPYREIEAFKCFADFPVGNTIGKNDDEGKRITQITLRNQTQQALQSIARFTGQLLHPTTTSSKQSQRAAVVGELEALADEYVC
jgi:hypothetical protein